MAQSRQLRRRSRRLGPQVEPPIRDLPREALLALTRKWAVATGDYRRHAPSRSGRDAVDLPVAVGNRSPEAVCRFARGVDDLCPHWAQNRRKITVETHGTDGQVLNVEDKVKEVKEDIVVALGLSRSLVTGDGPNFATASVSLRKMLVMIREITQTAKTILDWVFDDWLERNGWGGKTLQFLFNDLDPSDAVDFKRLLIELYDRKLISRSSLQLKMDLDPDIEAANRDSESQSVDLFDTKQVKPIVDMVLAGIMSVERAQKMLGLDPEKHTPTGTEAAWGGPSARGDVGDAVCDDCVHFEEARNHCRVHRSEVTFDTPACRFLDPKTPPLDRGA